MSWSTLNEISFVAGMRPDLLEDYLKAMPLRSNWGEVDPEEVKQAVLRRIAQEKEKK